MVKNVTYHNPIHQEENTPLVTILETRVDTNQATAVDSRRASYSIDLAKSAFGGTSYPVPGSQWYLKKISGVWTLMARAPQQNPQLNPANTPVAGETYIGAEGTTHVMGNLAVAGGVTVNGGIDLEIGTIKIHPSNTPPTGWLICDGSAISRTTYSVLYGIIGTTFGVGDGSTTFNIPNIKGKIPVGRDSGQTEFDVLGETGGEKAHTLNSTEMPSHTHVQDPHTHIQDTHTHVQNSHDHTQIGGFGAGPANAGRFRVDTNSPSATWGNDAATVATNQNTVATNQNTTATNQSTGGGGAHNNLQPYIALNYIIKALTSFIPPAVGTGLTADGFYAIGTSPTSKGHTGKVVGDIFERIIIHDNGLIELGSGLALPDTNLFRNGVGIVRTDNALQVGSTATVTGTLTASADLQVGTTATIAGTLTASADMTYDARSHARGILPACTLTAGTVANSGAGSEVAIPSASWLNEPTLTFVNGRLYEITVFFGSFPATALESSMWVRVRKGAASIVGTILANFQFSTGSNASNVAFRTMVGYCKNTSGSNVATKVSLTNLRIAGATTTNLYGDVDFPLRIVFEDIGATAEHTALAAIAPSV